jgi:hypothetical protein
MQTQNEQLNIIHDLCEKVWNYYVGGNMEPMKRLVDNKDFGSHFTQTVEFFLNREYANYRLENKIDFPSGLKSDNFLHICIWSSYFKMKYKKMDTPLHEIDLYQVVLEKRKLLNVFSKNLPQATVDKFEESFTWEKENLSNFQTFVFKLAKRELGFEENLESISQIYYNAPEKVEILKATILEVSLSFEFNDKINSDLKHKNSKALKKVKI